MANDIEKLDFPFIIRKRPGQFIGSTSDPTVIFREVIDNAIDELYASTKTNKIIIDVHGDHYLVQDNGRGIPIHLKPEHDNVTAVELAVANMYAGGKFDKSDGTIANGMNGIGVSCTNALSTKFVVLSRITPQNWNKSIKEVSEKWKSDSDKTLYYRIEFERGIKKIEDCITSSEANSEYGIRLDEETMTAVFFIPDAQFFDSVENCTPPWTNFEYLGEIMTRYYKRKIKVIYNGVDYAKTLDKYKFEFAGKINFHNSDYEYKLEKERCEAVNKPCNKDMWIYTTFEFNENITEAGSQEGSVNSLTVNQGVHVNTVMAGILDALEKKYSSDSPNLLKGLKIKVIILCSEVVFDAQTKTKLLNIPSMWNYIVVLQISKMVMPILNKNKIYFDDHIRKVGAFNEANQQLSERKLIKQAVKKGGDKNFNRSSIKKLTECYSDNRKECELFIVEGDSAGGTMKAKRDSAIHAVIGLKGRPLNTTNLKVDQILQNEEMKAISNAIGVGFKPDIDLRKIMYGKIIIGADADADGGVIASSVLAFLWLYMPDVIENGYVYIIETPLFKQGNTLVYPGDDVDSLIDRSKHFTRFKGLGEIDKSLAWDVFFNPETRKLTRVTPEGAERAVKYVDRYDPTLRRELMIKLGILSSKVNWGIDTEDNAIEDYETDRG